MKITIKITVIILLMVIPLIGKSQFKVSIGAEATSGGFGQIASNGFGITAGANYNIKEKFAVIAHAGYDYLLTKEDYESANMYHVQGGFNIYFKSNEGTQMSKPLIDFIQQQFINVKTLPN
jgi:hypothetical protein